MKSRKEKHIDDHVLKYFHAVCVRLETVFVRLIYCLPSNFEVECSYKIRKLNERGRRPGGMGQVI
jgi:hypothetical protein